MNCPRCGASAPESQKFCGECGTPLLSAGEPAPTGERRQLTVLFCDLVDSTAIGARLDPEDFRDVVAAYHHCVAQQVTQLGGFVARYMGDGVLCYFGYPVAAEDDAERAVRAAIAVVEAVPRLDTVAGPPGTLRGRAGIATGVVIVGHLIGAGEALEKAVVGDAPNLASRMQSLAEPGTVLIADSTRRLVGELFDYRDIGARAIKGYDQPVRVWRVLRESAIDSRFEALRSGGGAALFGRDEELALLLHRWREAQQAQGRVVVLSGEAGIGKSRLAAALEDRLRAELHTRRRYVCSPHHEDTVLHPVIGQLARAAGFAREDDAAAKLGKLAALVPREEAEDFALLADLLSLPADAGARLAELTRQRRKERTLAAILRELQRLTDAGPVLAVFEDFHWADPTTQELLARLVDQIEQMRLLLVITTRPDAEPAWTDHPAVHLQPLGRFDQRQANALIDGVAGDARLSQAVRDQIIAHADGVPLFVEELTKAVVESGVTEDDVLPGAHSPVAVPSTLHASLMARLDRLGGSKEIAQMGAVIGREFSFELFRSVFPIAEERLRGSLDALVAADLVLEQGQPPQATYSFRHALVQDAAYSSLLRERRRALHRQVAIGLERDGGGPEAAEPELLAYHFTEAGVADRAIDYHLRAAERAMTRCALAEMVSHLRRGLGLLASLPASPETRRRELALQVALGRGLIDQVGSASEQGHAAFVRARELCLELGDDALLLSVLYGLQVYHFSHAEPAAVIRYAHEILDLGQRTGGRAAILVGERVAGSAYLLLGRLAEARTAYEHLLALYETDKDGELASATARDPFVAGCSFLGVCLTLMGHPAQGDAMIRRALGHAKRLRHAISVVFALRRGCVEAMLRRDVARVKSLSARLLEVDTDYETFLGGPEGHLFQSWALLHKHHDPALWQRLRRSLDQLDETRTWALLSFLMSAAAELGAARGKHDDARALLERARELEDLTGERWCQAEVLRLEAALLTAHPADKADLLRRAIALADEQESRLWQLRAATDLAVLLRDQGACDEARDILAPILRNFSEAADLPDVQRGSRLLKALG
jgi:class 3 adenylate cyclase